MCDCYGHKCDHAGCDVVTPMHLEDYITGQDEIKVYCENHIPPGAVGTLWRYSEEEKPCEALVREWHTALVVPLTDTARAMADGNHPNAWFSVKQEGGK